MQAAASFTDFRQARRREWRRLALGALAGVGLVACAQAAGIEPAALFDADGRRNAADLLSGMATPDFSDEFVQRIGRLTLESLWIGLCGMALALVLGIPLALLAARVPEPARVSRRSLADGLVWVLRWGARATLAVLRAIPEIVWAFLFVRILGLGPGPAVLAIGLSFAGITGKLYAELCEAVDPRPVRTLRRAGVGRFGTMMFGVLPQVRTQWVGYGLFRFECALRSAAILGVVGAGGLGAEIDLSIRYFQYDKLATALLAVLGCVVLLEVLAAFLRSARPQWSLALVFGGAAWGGAALSLPLDELFSQSAVEQTRRFLTAFATPTTDADFVWAQLAAIGQTLAMAAAGTGIAAVGAFLLAPCATRTLTVRGYLPGAAPRRALWPVFLGARGVLQVTRALPGLVWALLFVVWIGPGPAAGALAVGAHTIGLLGRLFGEVYEEVEPLPARALEAAGAGRTGVWAFAVLPQVRARLLAYVLFRFEVNVRETAMVGFVGAGGIGDALHTAISLFHWNDLATLLSLLIATVLVVDAVGDSLRARLLARD